MLRGNFEYIIFNFRYLEKSTRVQFIWNKKINKLALQLNKQTYIFAE